MTSRGGTLAIGALGLWALLPAGACAVPDRGDPPPPIDTHAATGSETGGTAGEVSGDGSGEESTPKVSYAVSVHPLQVSTCAPGCHATGTGGFTISGDVDADYEATLARVVPGDPDNSKLLKKASGATSHTGGPLLPPDSEGYNLVAQWIRDGALP